MVGWNVEVVSAVSTSLLLEQASVRKCEHDEIHCNVIVTNVMCR